MNGNETLAGASFETGYIAGLMVQSRYLISSHPQETRSRHSSGSSAKMGSLGLGPKRRKIIQNAPQ
jgi:hypothetical protein